MSLRVLRAVRRGQRRQVQVVTFKRSFGAQDPVQLPAWREGVPIKWGQNNDRGLNNFFVSHTMDRMPANEYDLELPKPPLTKQKWFKFYIQVKEAHPMPVTEWLEEPGWLTTTRRHDPFLEEVRAAHERLNMYFLPPGRVRNFMGVQDAFPEASRLEVRQLLTQMHIRLKKKWSYVPATDKVLEWVKRCVGKKPVVMPQAHLGYWGAQMEQFGIRVVACYNDWLDISKRHGEPHMHVLERSGRKEFKTGVHDDHAVVLVYPEQYPEELDNWKGDTLVLIGQGAIDGSCDIGRYLLERNEGWELVDEHRNFTWPLMFSHCYAFKKMTDEERSAWKPRPKRYAKEQEEDDDDDLLGILFKSRAGKRSAKSYPSAADLGVDPDAKSS